MSLVPTQFLRLGLALPMLTAGLMLASCNQTDGPDSALKISSSQDTGDAERKSAIKSLASKLRSQKQELTRPKRVAAIDPKRFGDQPTGSVTIEKKLRPAPQNVKLEVPTQTAPVQRLSDRYAFSGPLAQFHAKLAALKDGSRREPVTVLHIGDSHVASDSFSRGIRKSLQSQFGNAGRGMVIPANAFKYGVADQVSLRASGGWRAQTALKQKRGPFGLSGVRVSSRSSRSVMKKTVSGPAFDWAAVTVQTGPSQGAFTLKIGDAKKRFDAYSKTVGSKRFQLNARGKKLTVVPGGGARTTVLSWSTGRETPGIRYVNFGLIGATVNITKRFNQAMIANDIKSLDPDLIVYGYGTNEGFNDRLQLASYRKSAARFMNSLRKNAPDADVVFLGAASGLRRRGNKACGGWSTPPKLGPLRKTVQQLAQEQNAAYWDWSKAMGGVCAINRWAGEGLAAKDRVHLTSKGYRRSASAFADWLVKPVLDAQRVALN